jgi:AraC-like DNA-binding protein
MKVYRNVRELFFDLVDEFEKKLKISLSEYSKIYLMKLLEQLAEGNDYFYTAVMEDKSLAETLMESVHKNIFEKIRDLKALGDLCLLFGGLYPEFMTKRLVDIDYYINIGKNSYNLISDTYKSYTSKYELYMLYNKLAEEYMNLVSILTEISDELNFLDKDDFYKSFKRWEKTKINKYSEVLMSNKRLLHNFIFS